MITRLLPRDEWPRLVGTELETVWPHFPDNANVVVVEDGDRIVGCWAVYTLVHVEGLWTATDYRKNPRVGRRLLMGMRNTALAMGAKAVQTAAVTPDVAAMLEKSGAYELPGRHFSLSVALRERKEPAII